MPDTIHSNDARIFIKQFRDLLSQEEEQELFRKWRETGDNEKYLTKIVIHYGPVIKRCIKELAGYQMPMDELLSEGMVALIEAAKRFELDQGVRFATYAKVCVRGMMHGYITKNYFLMHVCTNHTKKRLFYALRKRIAIAMMQTGQFKLTIPIAKEIADEHGVSITDVQQMYDMFQRPQESLSDPISSAEDDNLTRGDTISEMYPDGDSMSLVIEDDVVNFQKSIVTTAMHNVLTERERRIFTSQILTDKEDGQQTLDALGKELEISKERVRQLRNRASDKMFEEINRLTVEMGIDPVDLFVST